MAEQRIPTSADSPTKPRITHTPNYHSDLITISRPTLEADNPRVPEVKLESLLSAVLPDVSKDGTHTRVCEKLAREHIRDGRWSCLAMDPKRNSSHETKTYSFIADIFKSIVSAAGLPTLVECVINGNTVPLSQGRNNSSRPDGYLQLSNKTFPFASGDSWADIVMPMEFKKSPDARWLNDNHSKVQWSMHHTMRNDPRRRFVFGLTVSDTKMRLWFNDRCGVVSSTEFDINENWKDFVHIVLGVALADSNDLGYDPDVALVNQSKADSPQYDITVHSADGSKTIYRTVELISDIGAESLIGRGTRVWKVQKLANGGGSGPFFALKDVWVYDDRPMEHEAMKEIIGSARDSQRYFLSVEKAGFAVIRSNGLPQVDHTKDVIRRGKDFITTGKVLGAITMSRTQRSSGSKGASKSDTFRRPQPVQHSPSLPPGGHWNLLDLNRFPRQHYRIVFKEIGEPLHRLRSYQDIIVAVRGALQGLQVMHDAKYVHRDVSSGNILLVSDENRAEKRGVIIDLEYAKSLNSDPDPHGVKTGTYEFMAIEVARSEYINLPPLIFNAATATPEPRPDPPPFRQNQLHDLESVWWVCAWTTLRLVLPDTNQIELLQKKYEAVFETPGSRSSTWRGEFDDPATKHLSDSLRGAMVLWCRYLREAYKESYGAGKFVDIQSQSLEAARKAQAWALNSLADATKDYPWGLRFLSELKAAAAVIDVDTTAQSPEETSGVDFGPLAADFCSLDKTAVGTPTGM
ncbi:kinase domain protein [Ceratobasidium sp. AG-Ba]|nr:kinase domain protein [Ceratobasidium sp. AG-Ba]